MKEKSITEQIQGKVYLNLSLLAFEHTFHQYIISMYTWYK